jgi:hypothetical protein
MVSASAALAATIPRVFCSVEAVITPTGRQPSHDAVRTSAMKPAPPDGSSPEMTRTPGASVRSAETR